MESYAIDPLVGARLGGCTGALVEAIVYKKIIIPSCLLQTLYCGKATHPINAATNTPIQCRYRQNHSKTNTSSQCYQHTLSPLQCYQTNTPHRTHVLVDHMLTQAGYRSSPGNNNNNNNNNNALSGIDQYHQVTQHHQQQQQRQQQQCYDFDRTKRFRADCKGT